MVVALWIRRVVYLLVFILLTARNKLLFRNKTIIIELIIKEWDARESCPLLSDYVVLINLNSKDITL